MPEEMDQWGGENGRKIGKKCEVSKVKCKTEIRANLKQEQEQVGRVEEE